MGEKNNKCRVFEALNVYFCVGCDPSIKTADFLLKNCCFFYIFYCASTLIQLIMTIYSSMPQDSPEPQSMSLSNSLDSPHQLVSSPPLSDSSFSYSSTQNYNLALVPAINVSHFPQLHPPSPPPPPPKKNQTVFAPAMVHRDQNGIDYITFSYSRDRTQKCHTIRCDIEKVDIESLSDTFKQENCIYPRACVPPEEYKGTRQKYESECNSIGWCLAYINPSIQKRRGLVQRAVDSWRNTNANPSLRSRRVRRMSRKQEKLRRAKIAEAATRVSSGITSPTLVTTNNINNINTNNNITNLNNSLDPSLIMDPHQPIKPQEVVQLSLPQFHSQMPPTPALHHDYPTQVMPNYYELVQLQYNYMPHLPAYPSLGYPVQLINSGYNPELLQSDPYQLESHKL